MPGGLGKFCLNKGGGNAEKAAKIMNDEVVEHCGSGCSFQCDIPLSKFLVDWDTKEFLVKHVGINSWDDLSEEDKNVSGIVPGGSFLIGMTLLRKRGECSWHSGIFL